MTERLTPRRIAELHGALHRIDKLDETTKTIGEWLEGGIRSEEWGCKVRAAFGANTLTQWRNRFLGEIASCAIINELMRERAELVEDIGDLVDVPLPPTFATQNPDRENR